jgi:hypothetical protein
MPIQINDYAASLLATGTSTSKSEQATIARSRAQCNPTPCVKFSRAIVLIDRSLVQVRGLGSNWRGRVPSEIHGKLGSLRLSSKKGVPRFLKGEPAGWASSSASAATRHAAAAGKGETSSAAATAAHASASHAAEHLHHCRTC